MVRNWFPGIVDITDDSQEVIRYEYVQADADIYVCHSIAYYDTFPLDIEKKVWPGKIKQRFFSAWKQFPGPFFSSAAK